MSTLIVTIIKIIGLFLLAALASEVAAGIINGGSMGNSTITLITSTISTVTQGVIDLIISLPKLILNFAIALINGLLNLSIPYIP